MASIPFNEQEICFEKMLLERKHVYDFEKVLKEIDFSVMTLMELLDCRRYEKLVVLLFTDPTNNVDGAKGYFLCELPKVGGAIAPPVPPPLS